MENNEIDYFDFELQSFEGAPLLRGLMINYCIVRDEEYAMYMDDDDLWGEYCSLKEQNLIHKIFEAEWFNSEARLRLWYPKHFGSDSGSKN
jgi:hypothetical protein